MTVSDRELTAFRKALAEAGFDERDFEILREEDLSPDVGIHASGCIDIHSRLNDRTRRYRAEPEAGWASQFHQDLAAGIFGTSARP